MNNIVEKKFKGNVGIFLAAAKLSELNLIALTTSRNTEGYDIVVLNPKTNRGIGIQVKCTDKKDFPICATYIKNFEEELKQKIVCDYVLVDISNKPPRFFIIPKDDLINIMANLIKKWTAKFYTQQERQWRNEKKKQLWTINISKLEEELKKYEDNWNSVLKEIE